MARKGSFCMHTSEAISISGSAGHTSEAQIANNFCKNCQILLLYQYCIAFSSEKMALEHYRGSGT